MTHQHISALSLAVVRDGVVRCAAYGQADRARPIPALPETTYNIASLGKQFIASAIMLLDANNKIRLDEKAVTYLQGAFPVWKDITITQLLTHTSGLPGRPEGLRSEESCGFAPARWALCDNGARPGAMGPGVED